MNSETIPSSTSQTMSLNILIIAFAIGIISALLFNNSSWGVNVILFSLLLAISLIVLRKKQGRGLSLVEGVLTSSALFFAFSLAWRDSSVLNHLSLFSIVNLAVFAFILGTREKLKNITISHTFQDCIAASQYAFSSYPALLTKDIQWDTLQNHWQHSASALIRGVFITIPVILVFGILLMSSDERFESAVTQLFDWNGRTIILRGFTFFLCSGITIVLLRASILGFGLYNRLIYLPTWQLGSIEITMLLSVLNLLFISFIAVQFTYFFGGDALVQSADGLTYSAYARRGFFQLVAVAILVIALLLITNFLHHPLNEEQKKRYSILAIVMVILTMIIEASAIHRMFLYTRVYGLTELRFYTSVFMLWLIVVFILFSISLLKTKENTVFTFSTLVAGLVINACLLVINPDARIADVNLARLQAGEELDLPYLSLLSTDVIPTLATALPTLPEKQRCELWKYLGKSPVLTDIGDWRNWHFSHYHAKKALSEVKEKEISLQCKE